MKDVDSAKCSDHEIKVANVFYTLSTSEIEVPSDKRVDTEAANINKVDISTNKLTLEEIVDIDELVSDQTVMSNGELVGELKAFFNLKRYKINPMCSQSLNVIG